MKTEVETEVKIPISSAAGVIERLHCAGLTLSSPRQFESNTLYDTGDKILGSSGTLLRLRQSGEKYLITWKGPGGLGSHKMRRELETSIGSLETMHQILGRLGYEPAFRYEKYRTEFLPGGDGAGVVTLDETPIGDFLELEGPGEWIDEMAKRLGFSQQDYVLESYGGLYLADCKRRGVQPGHMVFASQS